MGITVDKVHAAADALLQRGETPTLAAVRRELGRGSFTTISEAMRSWRERRQRDQASPPPAPPAQLQELAVQYAQVAVRAVWEAAQEQLRAQGETDLQSARELLEQMEAEQRDTAQLADDLSRELEETRISLRASQEVQEALRQELAEARQESADLRARMAGIAARTENLGEQIDSLGRERDAYRERCLQQERLAGQWQAEREALERSLRELRGERDKLLGDRLQGQE